MFSNYNSLFLLEKPCILDMGDFTHDYGCNMEFRAPADRGKTLAMIAFAHDLMLLGYDLDDIVHNIPNLHFPMFAKHGTDQPMYVTNERMRQYMAGFMVKGTRHKIIMVSEADKVWPSRGFKEKEQTEQLLSLNQTMKTETWWMCDGHAGTSMDKLIRDSCNVSWEPFYDIANKRLILTGINGIDNDDNLMTRIVEPLDKLFNMYLRWKPVL